MFRYCVTSSATIANSTVFKLSIRRKSASTKRKRQLASNEATEARLTSHDTSVCKTSVNNATSIDYTVHEQTDEKNTALKGKYSNLSLVSDIDELKTTNKFKLMEKLQSFSIFGSEAAESEGIQCTEDNEDKTKPSIPSVTYILNETMSLKAKAALELWKKNIIDKFGKDYFRIFCKGLLDDGKLFHSCIQNVLSHKEFEIPPRVKSAYFSVEPILNDIQNVYKLETYVTHPILRYRGIVDCIASYRDQVYVIDWKKSGKQKASLAATFDAPVQLAAYIGAINASNEYSFRIDRGLVVVAYTNGEPASVHELNNNTLQKAWEEWLRRLELFYRKSNEAN
ncbi:mitochondrial genome maintenance exonuclease 1-like [Ceratina calcarata]|uniref:Mitochondrial genome maintenance exonuclease 1 n=1 Tax=Ceratina calcarata TaxID=156304 RepID=A0AAJ7IXZ7_9HYME|nr:mitochondrial genome maintenance exonuclease 1-like [Ceratina calcarata]